MQNSYKHSYTCIQYLKLFLFTSFLGVTSPSLAEGEDQVIKFSKETLITAVSGDTVAIASSGEVSVYRQVGVEWVEETRLSPEDGFSDASFGNAIAIAGNTLVVGAYFEDTQDSGLLKTDAGAIYVFERFADEWSQTARLTASDAGAFDRFGNAVDISGDLIIAGAKNKNGSTQIGNTLFDVGAAYIFQKQSGGWSEVAQLTPLDQTSDKNFGNSVALFGSTAIVGAYLDSDPSTANEAGAAYIFKQLDGKWTQSQKLIASDASTSDEFGASVDIGLNQAIIGAHRSGKDQLLSGAAYLFENDGGSWVESLKLQPPSLNSGDFFGTAVALSRNRIVVGAPYSDSESEGSGAAYLFRRDPVGSWIEESRLVSSNGETGSFFGLSVGLDQTTAAVGSETGSAYLFNVAAPTEGFGDTYPPNISFQYSAFSISGIAGDDEDVNLNGVLESSEDLNANGVLDARTEDTNGDGVLEEHEDINNNLMLDSDTGIESISLESEGRNLEFVVKPFLVGASRVEFQLNLVKADQDGEGTVTVSDLAGNTTSREVRLTGETRNPNACSTARDHVSFVGDGRIAIPEWSRMPEDEGVATPENILVIDSSDNPDLFVEQPWISYPSWSLYYEAKPGVTGSSNVIYRVYDVATQGQRFSCGPESFTISVRNPVETSGVPDYLYTDTGLAENEPDETESQLSDSSSIVPVVGGDIAIRPEAEKGGGGALGLWAFPLILVSVFRRTAFRLRL